VSDSKLNSSVVEVLDQVFLHPSRSPDEACNNGVVLTADRPRFIKTPLLNIEKPTYLRQSFAKSVKINDEQRTRESKTRLCTTYGTGSGLRTHGTPKEQLVFRSFTPEIEYICNSIEKEVKKQFSNDNDVKSHVELNNMEIVTYYDDKQIKYHRDQRYNRRGKFMKKENAQKQHTVTCILVVGDDRDLEFQLFRNKTKNDIGPGNVKIADRDSKVVFHLKHGDLFFLHPEDERDQIRHAFPNSLNHLTFFKHRCIGVKKDHRRKGIEKHSRMSHGLVFRCCVHVNEVDVKTGQLVLNAEEKIQDVKMWKNINHKKLTDFVRGQDVHRGSKLKREAEDQRRKAIYLQMKRRRFV
jgi:hypothetical protein